MPVPWYDLPFFLGLTALNLGIAAAAACASYFAMSVALRLARGAIDRMRGAGAGRYLEASASFSTAPAAG